MLGYLAIVLFRPTVEGWIGMVTGADVAWVLAWVGALLFIGLTLAASIAELLRDRLGADGSARQVLIRDLSM